MWESSRIPGHVAFHLAATAAVWILLPFTSSAQPREAGVVITLTGSATLSRAGASQSLRSRDSLFNGDTITTAANSTLRVLLACTAIATARERSAWSLAVAEGRAGLSLSDGRMGLTIARQIMAQDDFLHVRTPNAFASVRGSSVVVDVHRNAPGARITSLFSVLSGPVEVFAAGATVRVGSGQRLRVRDDLAGVVEGLSNEESELLAADLKGARPHSTAIAEFSEMLAARERDRALGHVFGRGGDSSGAAPQEPRREGLLAAPPVSDVRQRHDTAATPARCTARGIVRESDTSAAP
jgi:hypothetical protein